MRGRQAVRLLYATVLLTVVELWSALTGRAAGYWYVAPGGNDGYDCASPATACATINGALNKPGFVAGDTVRVAVGTYTGTGSQVVLVDKDAKLSGGWNAAFTSQTGSSTIEGQAGRRGVTVNRGVSATIDRFTVTHGWDWNAGGAGIFNEGTLALKSGIIVANITDAGDGGGILNNGTLILTNSTIRGNASARLGGGIASTGVLTVTESTVDANTAGNPGCRGNCGGAGIAIGAGTAAVEKTTLSNNQILGNFAGSGIAVVGGTLNMSNCTVTGNKGGDGDGIFVTGGIAYIYSSTIVNNATYGVNAYAGDIRFQNTILSNNGPSTSFDCYNQPGSAITSLGYSLIQKSSYCNTSPTDVLNLEAGIVPLANNGGPTRTHALVGNSPAIDRGNPTGCMGSLGPLTTDQRGMARVGRCDIGAFEVQRAEAARTVFLPLVVSPPGWTTVAAMDFEGEGYPGAWRVTDENGMAGGEYYWGRRTCRPWTGNHSGWAPGGGAYGSYLPCNNIYPNNTRSWIHYGPFSLVGATAAQMRFVVWVNTPGYPDRVSYFASVDHRTYYGYYIAGNTGGWVTRVMDLSNVGGLGNLIGRPSIWVAIRFYSDGAGSWPEGAYVDDLVLRKCMPGAMCVSSGAPTLTGLSGVVEAPDKATLP